MVSSRLVSYVGVCPYLTLDANCFPSFSLVLWFPNLPLKFSLSVVRFVLTLYSK